MSSIDNGSQHILFSDYVACDLEIEVMRKLKLTELSSIAEELMSERAEKLLN